MEIFVLKRAAAIVTNPVAKNVLYRSGFPEPGHTEYLGKLAEEQTGIAAQPVMMLWSPELAVVPVMVQRILQLPDETLRSVEDVELMTFPRLPGVAEVGWSPAAARRWDDFRRRLAAHGPRWSAMAVRYHRSPQVPWPD